jgi:hypothetical protein
VKSKFSNDALAKCFYKFLFGYVTLGFLLALITVFANVSFLILFSYAASLPLLNATIGCKYGEMAIKGGVVKIAEEPNLFKFVMVLNIVAVLFYVYFVFKLAV